jgi:hypothetical protein
MALDSPMFFAGKPYRVYSKTMTHPLYGQLLIPIEVVLWIVYLEKIPEIWVDSVSGVLLD